MASGQMTVELVGDREMVITREFAAPRDLVWQAYTEAERLLQWWGPREWPATHCTVDLRAGGKWHYCMTGPNGEEGWGIGTYKEITPPERLVYMDAFSNADGDVIPPESEITLTFTDLGGRTLMTSRSVYASKEERQQVIEMGVEAGLAETLERLDEYLAAAQG